MSMSGSDGGGGLGDRAKRVWADFRRWPRSAQIVTWIVAALIVLAALGSFGSEDGPEPVTVVDADQTTTTVAALTTTTILPTTTTTAAPTTTTTVPPTTTTTAPPTTTTTAPPPPPPPTTTAPPPPPPTTVAQSSTYYANCSAARAAGAAPVHRGDPGYGSHLDRDNDGVGCEN